MDIRKRFGQRIREERMKMGLSQEAFAALIGLDRTYVGAVERGERNISLVNIERMAIGLGKKVCDLFRE